MSSPPPVAPSGEADPPRTTTCIHTDEGRSLILNIDGTANQFCEHSTNVVELFSRIIRDANQLAYYDSGIGTYARPSFRSLSYLKQVVYHAIDTAIAWNFESIIHAAYEWLSENYQPGDRIFLFGFSRGAYQVRVIAGMIEKVGLLLKGNKRQIPFAYELYSSVMDTSTRNPTSNPAMAPDGVSLSDVPPATAPLSKEEKLCAQFKRTLCHENVKVHFIGAWDTVSSIGIFRGKSLPETVSGMGHVCHFRHALALDECRVKFQPEYANGGLGPHQGAQRGDVKEVWFAGSHSDIGGGNIPNEELANFGPSLRWVTYEAVSCGLRVKPYTGKWVSNTPTNSLTWHWKLLEVVPFGSLSYTDEDSTTWWPHLGARRSIQPGQLIHQSVFERFRTSHVEDSSENTRFKGSEEASSPSTRIEATSEELSSPKLPSNLRLSESDEDFREFSMPGAFRSGPQVAAEHYLPAASLPDGTPDWRQLHECHSAKCHCFDWLVEKDPYEDVKHTFQTLKSICNNEGSNPDLHAFDAAIQALQPVLDDETRRMSFREVYYAGSILVSALRFLHAYRRTDVRSRSKVIDLLRDIRIHHWSGYATSEIREWLAYSDVTSSDRRYVLQNFGEARLKSVKLGQGYIQSVSFSFKTPGQVIAVSRTSGTEICLSFLDGPSSTLTASRSALSGDGLYLGVADERGISIFKAESTPNDEAITYNEKQSVFYLGLALPEPPPPLCRPRGIFVQFSWLRRGTDPVIFTFSWDKSQLAYITDKRSPITICNIINGKILTLNKRGVVRSMAWSPCGRRITFGGPNGSVETWDIDLGESIRSFKPASDHPILSVAYRSDGRLLATGDFWGVTVWRCEPWTTVWKFESSWVTALAFSPDGKQLASGSDDGIVEVWDVEFDDW